MDRGYLRPPFALYQLFAAMLALPLLVAGVAIWAHSLPDLQGLYLRSYVKASVPKLPRLHKRAEVSKPVVLIAYGRTPALEPLDWSRQPHPAVFAMTRAQERSWLRTYIYGGEGLLELVRLPLLLTALVCFGLWTGAWYLDQERHLEFRQHGRQLRGPEMRTRREFARVVKGAGIGWLVEERRFGATRFETLRIARDLETQHVQMIGDTGSGKTQSILHITDEAEAHGESCVVYDPHREFVTRYYRPERGDVILNSTDARCAHWDPSYEVDYTDRTSAEATALAQAASLYPGSPQRRDWFFTNASRLIWQYCMVHHRPDANEMAQLMTHADPLIDAISKGTELEEMLRKNAEGQRAGIISTLTAPVFALRQVPEPEVGRPDWSAREWAKDRRGWIFLTSTQDTRDALRPLQSLWIDSLILRLLSMGDQPRLPRVRMILDELPTLQELSQLKSALSEARKSGLTIIVGFQGRSGIKAIYGEEAEGLFSAPYTKIILRTGEAEAAEWASKMIGEREVERIREHRGVKGERTYTTEQRTERVVMPSELAGLQPRCGYLRYGNEIVPIKIALARERPAIAEGYVQRVGEEVAILPMPNLDQIRAREEAERERKAEQAAAYVYRPGSKPKRGPNGSSKQEGLWNSGN